jgi:hypothetical protein
MFSLEELAIIIGLFAVIHHEIASSLFEEGLWQTLLWHHYHRHPLSQPITLRYDWEAHLNDPALPDHDAFFRARFRMSVPTVHCLIAELSPFHATFVNGRPRISLQKMVIITLFRLGHDLNIYGIAELFGISTGAIIGVTCYIINLIHNNLLAKYVTWPGPIERAKLAKEFLNVGQNDGRFTGVIGAIDGSHIEIHPQAIPLANRRDYYNRKSMYSVIMQAIVDWKLRFRDLCIGIAGSQHDSYVLALSGIPDAAALLFSAGQYILGDCGYPLRLWLLTPFRESPGLTPTDRKYNRTLSSMRVCVEMAFGHLKGRFPSLSKKLNVSLHLVPQYISAACVLHNFCVDHRDLEWKVDSLPSDNDDVPPADIAPDATLLRNSILRKFT